MAARERLLKSKALSTEVLNSDSDGSKQRKHKIPNYKKSHDKMRKELENRWNDNITTSPQPFTLRTAKLHRRKVNQSTFDSLVSLICSDTVIILRTTCKLVPWKNTGRGS
jgi:hypothetical protein